MKNLYLLILILFMITIYNHVDATAIQSNTKAPATIHNHSKKAGNDITYCQQNCGINPNNQVQGCIQNSGNTCGQNCDCSPGNLCASSGYCLPKNQVLCSYVNCPYGPSSQNYACQEPYWDHSCSSDCDCSPGRSCKGSLCK